MARLRPTILPIPSNDTEKYDLFIAAVGFEARATASAERLVSQIQKGIGVGFGAQEELSFQQNQAWFRRHGFETPAIVDPHFEDWVKTTLARELQSATRRDTPWRIGIDISSFSRFRLAVLVDFFRSVEADRPVAVDFHYTLAAYSPPAQDEGPNAHVGPVTPAYAGWTREPEEPVTAIVGLGYEVDRALGAVEHVQASELWLLRPDSPLAEYEPALDDANALLVEVLPASSVLRYPALDPLYTFAVLEGLVARCLLTGGCMVFPFGPKVLATVSLLVACVHPDVAIWRVSAGINAPPSERYASNFFCAIRAVFDPSASVDWRAEAAELASWY